MGFLKFSILTLVGAGVWCAVLAWLGGRVGEKLTPAELQNADAIISATKAESFPIIAAIVLVMALYFLAMRLTRPKVGTSHSSGLNCDGARLVFGDSSDAAAARSFQSHRVEPTVLNVGTSFAF